MEETILRKKRRGMADPVECRAYREEDYDAVCAFLIALNQNDRRHVNWNWARFEWMIEHPEFDKSAIRSIGLWWEQDRIVGAAIYDMYFGEAFCAALPGYDELYPDILDYAYRELKDEAGLGVALCDGSLREIEAAEAAGFAPVGQSETVMRLELDALSLRALPKGYSFVELDPAQQPEDFQWLLWQGFDHGSDRAEFLRSDPIIPQRRPHLNRRLSLAAAAPDGTLAAYCCVWAHPDTDYAYVEPVCTAPAHRGKGLAAALLSEALTRSKALGAREAFVISDLPFYEKLGFEKTHHYIFYRKENEMNSCCMIRPERPEEHREVENLVREAFWNVYRPGCSEHYVLHVLRNDPAFVKELDFVMERDGRLIGQNMFMKTHIEADDGRLIPVLTMGPIGITPELKRQGYGKKLLDYSLEKAAELGFGAVLFEGNIGFYGKSGFTYARNFGIRYHDLPEGADDSFFLCKELIPGYLDAVMGVYQTPQGYYVDDADVEAFDRDFPPKEKLKLPGQLFG